jgi:hypothetical protein
MKRCSVTEKFSAGRCDRCGCRVGFEDGIRQDFCLCDPRCACCGRQFIPACGRGGGAFPEREAAGVCGQCVEEEVVKRFSEEFLNSLNRNQMSLLIRDVANWWQETGRNNLGDEKHVERGE